MIGMIAAVTMNGVIGIDGKLPFDYPEDLKHFRKTTVDSVVIMGRKTFEGIGRPLPRRENIVITSRKLEIPGITCRTSVWAAVERESIILRDCEKDLWLIGGATVYEEGMKFADQILLTVTPIYEFNKDAIRFPWINPTMFYLESTVPLDDEMYQAGTSKLLLCTYKRKS